MPARSWRRSSAATTTPPSSPSARWPSCSRWSPRRGPISLVAGPAFLAGRYGVACGALCAAVQAQLEDPGRDRHARGEPGRRALSPAGLRRPDGRRGHAHARRGEAARRARPQARPRRGDRRTGGGGLLPARHDAQRRRRRQRGRPGHRHAARQARRPTVRQRGPAPGVPQRPGAAAGQDAARAPPSRSSPTAAWCRAATPTASRR